MLANEMIQVEDATTAWQVWWEELCNQADNGYLQPSRIGSVVGEVINAITVITNPIKGFCESKTRKASRSYAVGELLWYLSGSNRVEDIAQFSSAWKDLTDDGKTLNSAYGHRIYNKFGFNQWEHCKNLLKKDPFTRQAVIHIKDADSTPTLDTPCTVCLQYFLRDGALYATTYMRSNDIWLGFPYDVFAFTSLQVKMAMELGVNIGHYTHIAGSLHLYCSTFDDYKKKQIKADTSTATKKAATAFSELAHTFSELGVKSNPINVQDRDQPVPFIIEE